MYKKTQLPAKNGKNSSALLRILQIVFLISNVCFIWTVVNIASKLQHIEPEKLNIDTRVSENQVNVIKRVLTQNVSTIKWDEENNIDSLSLGKTLSLHVLPSNFLCKSGSSRGQGCSPRKDDLQDLFKEKTTSLGDLFYWRIPNSTIYDSSCAFVYPVTQGLTDTESALTQESHTDNPDNVASEAELHVPVQATDATENDVYIHPGLADRQNQHNEDVELDAEGAVGGAELHVPMQATDATENDVYIHPGLADRHNEDVELDAEGAVGGDAVSANYGASNTNNMHSLRTSRGHYQNILADVHGLGYAWGDVHKAVLEYLRIAQSLHNLRAEDLQAILDEWDTPLSPEALLEENKRLRGRTKCHSCDEKELKILFLPCGHLVACEVCAEKFSQCPCCKAKITGRVRVYMG
ncbi:uncharacterized protein LOC128238218 isoform X2 [Mya arenaria]|uniref:uncharacterized protein LOC128238218 isoform X2 n=1 Tax=Mya arenaria TaxID=6604 RepID=UPI0022E006E3|nr:uncharacterized protein LOC128238218 isoform X2 [Mya arenaria]